MRRRRGGRWSCLPTGFFALMTGFFVFSAGLLCVESRAAWASEMILTAEAEAQFEIETAVETETQMKSTVESGTQMESTVETGIQTEAGTQAAKSEAAADTETMEETKDDTINDTTDDATDATTDDTTNDITDVTRDDTTTDISSLTILDDLMEGMDFSEVQELLDDMLGQDSFSFADAVGQLVSGENAFSKEAVQEFLQSLFFDRLAQEKAMFLKILLLIFTAALFSNFASVFDSGQIGEVSFYMVYLMLFVLLVNSFQELSESLQESLTWMTDFMKSLSPAYFLAVAASTGSSTATVFYQGVLILIGLIQWLLLTFLLPGANLFILLRLINHLSREDSLSKMAELLETAVNWGLKTLLGFAVGLQIVKGLITPVMDSLKRTALGRTASAIPGIGNAFGVVTDLILTSAVLVKNCLGAAALIVLLIAGAAPVIHYGFLSLAYRFLAALSQPVSDKRMVGCLSTMGEGCALLLRILLTGELLCMLTFVILAVSLGGGS